MSVSFFPSAPLPYKAICMSTDNKDDCPTCLEPLANGELIVAHEGEGAKHPIHHKCISEWVQQTLQTNSTTPPNCPTCQANIDADSLSDRDISIMPPGNPALPPAVQYDPEELNEGAALTAAEMPASLTGQALKWGMEQDWLHPANRGQGTLSKTVGKYFLRPLLRLIYGIAVALLIAPVGTLYHLGAALYHRVKQDRSRAWEHLKAAKNDVTSIPLLGTLYCAGGIYTQISTARCFNDSQVREPFSALLSPSDKTHSKFIENQLEARI